MGHSGLLRLKGSGLVRCSWLQVAEDPICVSPCTQPAGQRPAAPWPSGPRVLPAGPLCHPQPPLVGLRPPPRCSSTRVLPRVLLGVCRPPPKPCWHPSLLGCPPRGVGVLPTATSGVLLGQWGSVGRGTELLGLGRGGCSGGAGGPGKTKCRSPRALPVPRGRG